jgi:hypothetical protein
MSKTGPLLVEVSRDGQAENGRSTWSQMASQEFVLKSGACKRAAYF